MNEYDSDYLAQSLINYGLSAVDNPNNADIILINTCTVRAKPQQKALSMLGRISAIKKRRPELIFCIAGCLAQEMGVRLFERFPDLDLIMGPRDIGKFYEILDSLITGRKKVIITDTGSAPPDPVRCSGFFNGRISGNISIMVGCDNFCSYCIVPYVRGREISRFPDAILSEARNMISAGIKEITLLGQNVNSYFWNKETNFPSLLHKMGTLDGLYRVRFTTSHPKDMSDELIKCFGEKESILCPHIHLPFQAGSNRVLEKMRRGYTREKYMDLVYRLREVEPDIAITSDVMVGFPGESSSDFELTLDLIKKVQFDSLFSFKYSDRDGTLASKMDNKVDESEKVLRLGILQDLQKQITLGKNRSLEGKKMSVLVEGISRKGGYPNFSGRTASNKVVNFSCDSNMIGHLVNVEIKEGMNNSLKGEIIL
ncbi:MAG: tRNA (N6-isopentenyl adenosine(37)-C2)-methylthiotransferase MiaB [Deltaproteobacteria bacterium]|nr:tRNA (N6-isopentenyl adenosine(37)-C2)-methylthiotransferase MiaB [Deltaproteobacteria bacterium]